MACCIKATVLPIGERGSEGLSLPDNAWVGPIDSSIYLTIKFSSSKELPGWSRFCKASCLMEWSISDTQKVVPGLIMLSLVNKSSSSFLFLSARRIGLVTRVLILFLC